jgi:hypothetical protein
MFTLAAFDPIRRRHFVFNTLLDLMINHGYDRINIWEDMIWAFEYPERIDYIIDGHAFTPEWWVVGL